ncbi:hypothetical protein [Pseudomonas aeruginosa]|uniref:hypothetical protein n=1 Tax=Pseudomonas aeruginosa TaxID=287 RepID=UPI00217D0D9A|nr:hypothetical protein [Pseudomonas aeruginosa]UWG52576.1 hypothetical protein NOQ96_17700 [Pseudomonas aeruginosa]UWG52584.1 hypothetical protein NOQ96_17740 [Pseudomonas aeruginosa]
MSKVYRVKEEFVEVLEERRINMIIETREDIAEADLVNAALWRYLDKVTTKDVLEYKEEFGSTKKPKKRAKS